MRVMDNIVVAYEESYVYDDSAESNFTDSISQNTAEYGSDEIVFDENLSNQDHASESSITIPGSEHVEHEVREEPKQTTWKDDRDVSKFMDYITSVYPSAIPKHDGKTTVGCERAINFLEDLNRQISEAIKLDSNDVLDMPVLEELRVRIVRDVAILKDHLNKLKRKLRDSNDKKAEEQSEQIVKEAALPKLNVIVSAFERAIVGILINATVSAGHPFETVWSFLKEKYDINDREELSIMQLVMDSGFHLFKDRGVMSSKTDKDNKGSSTQGVDFIRNYFA